MNKLRVTVAPADHANRVTLQMADPGQVTFADGADTHQLSSSPEEVEIFGPNIFNDSEENQPGKATINYTVGEGGDPTAARATYYSWKPIAGKSSLLGEFAQDTLIWSRYSFKNWLTQGAALLKPTDPALADYITSFANGPNLPARFDPLYTSLVLYPFNAIDRADPTPIDGTHLDMLGMIFGAPASKIGQFQPSLHPIYRGLTMQDFAAFCERVANDNFDIGTFFKRVGLSAKFDNDKDNIHITMGADLDLEKAANRLEKTVINVPIELKFGPVTLKLQFDIPNSSRDWTYQATAQAGWKF